MRVSLSIAAELLKNGNVVAVPTETVYGLAASLDNPQAIDKIYALKGRPSNNPLIIHIDNISALNKYNIATPPFFKELTQKFWPGPLTLVMPIDQNSIPANARAGLPTAAFRMPRHPLTLDLLKMTGPLVMPSANISGKPSATCLQHVEKDFGIDFPVLDGGSCKHGLESTILYYDKNCWKIVRQGAISAADFREILAYEPELAQTETPLCPGQLYRHYAPQAKLILTNDFSGIEKETIIGFNDRKYPEGCTLFLLGRLSHPEEIGENLYAVLRELDTEGVKNARVDMNFPRTGILATVAERLERAANS